jgi:hypothetical protein
MAGGLLGEATLADHARQGLLAGGRRERAPRVSRRQQPGAGPLALPVHPPQLQAPWGQWDQAVVAACALAHAHQHALRGDGRARARRPCPPAQPTGRAQLQTHPGGRVRDQGPPGADLPPTPHDREVLGVPRAHEVEDRPRAPPRARVEESTPIALTPEGALGDLLLSAQAEERLAPLRVAELGRRASVVVRQWAGRVAIALVGGGGQAPER